jgi:hypothetical protein
VDGEVRQAAQWYEDRQTGKGDNFLDAISEAQLEIEKHPLRFPCPPGVATKRQIRRKILNRFPYAIVYEVLNRELLIIAVTHTSRRPGYWLKRK